LRTGDDITSSEIKIFIESSLGTDIAGGARSFAYPIWNPSGFYVIDKLPNDPETSSAYFVINIIIAFEKAIFLRGRAPHRKQLVIHLDNCSVHISRASADWLEEHGIRRMSHPRYSSDLTPSDFYLFLTVKEKLERFR
jgi:hypothetical protein